MKKKGDRWQLSRMVPTFREADTRNEQHEIYYFFSVEMAEESEKRPSYV
jgi:hypothetical protein